MHSETDDATETLRPTPERRDGDPSAAARSQPTTTVRGQDLLVTVLLAVTLTACSFRSVDEPGSPPAPRGGAGFGGSQIVTDGGWIATGGGGAGSGGAAASGGGTAGSSSGGFGGAGTGGVIASGGVEATGGVGTGGFSTGGFGTGGFNTGGFNTGGFGTGGFNTGGFNTGGFSTGGIGAIGGSSGGSGASGGTGGSSCVPFSGFTTWKNPGLVQNGNSSGGTITWSNTSAAKASDNVYATAVLKGGASAISEYLWARSFGFQVPTGAIVNGIEVAIERRRHQYQGAIWDRTVRLVKAGALTGKNKDDSSWPSSDKYKTFGSSNDLWNTTWSASQVNSSTFGLALEAYTFSLSGTTSATAYVDHIRIRVHYTNTC